MKRFVLWLAVLAVAAPGCQDPEDPQAMMLLGNTFVSSRTQCQVRGGATEFRSRGILDLAVTNTYMFFPQVENLLPESGELHGLTEAELRMDANGITVIGVEVLYDIDFFDDAMLTAADWDDFQGMFFHASGTTQPGEILATSVPIIPWELGNQLRSRGTFEALGGAGAEIIARVRVHGLLSDKTRVQSNELWFPITVCNGCLVYFPPAVDPRRLEENISVPCFIGQDDGVDTRLCYATAFAPTQDEDSVAEALEETNVARDRCRWLHILSGLERPDSRKYWDLYGQEIYGDAYEGPIGFYTGQPRW